jgi:hypothetical protein
MQDLFASGLAADLLLAIIALEAVALYALGRRGIGPGLGAVAPFLAAGAFLVLALRAALVGAAWPYLAVPLALSGAAHAVDLARRFRG